MNPAGGRFPSNDPVAAPGFFLGLSLCPILAICIFPWADGTVGVFSEFASLR
ncbi:hypothetical protein DPMN_186081 [Dreissena polymorpha]|uniref:Uncharacterized protein n=1 Tax=Dreissena polymorpha TaxID=45954 RepID=A0A9D4DNH9_DREPO|nr:hypothetical protein DPMN_186081 [Dreissena polymorpha]